jgi:hypothetical protein
MKKVPLGRECTCEFRASCGVRICSHVAVQETKAGEPLYSDLNCLLKAIEMARCVKKDTNEYAWWGHHVGDYPIPKGMRKEDLGKNAEFVIALNDEAKAEVAKLYGGSVYEVGVVADPNNPGCWTVIYDFYGGGRGIDKILGAPVRDASGKLVLLCPKLKQMYDMVCESQSAVEAGDTIKFMTLAQARLAYPQHFGQMAKQADEENTWVSCADTGNRVGVR